MNVVFALMGRELIEPLVAGVTDPMPLFMANVLALVVTQVSVVRAPGLTFVGDAESTHVGAGGGGGGGTLSTVTVALHVAVPPAPITVPV